MVDSLLTPQEQQAITEDAAPPAPVEQQPEEQPTIQPRDEEGRFATHEQDRQVPHGALHQERERHRETKSQLATAREQLAQIAEFRRKVQEQQTQTPQIDPNAPADGVQHLNQRMAQIEAFQNQELQQRGLSHAEEQEARVLSQHITTSEAEFVKQTPDYQQAIDHLTRSRFEELALYGLDPMSAQEQIRQEAMDIVRSAVAAGKDPAGLAYQVARQRGYVPNQQTAPNTAMLDAVARGQKSSRSLGSMSGGSPQVVDANAVAQMSEADILRMYETAEGRALLESIG